METPINDSRFAPQSRAILSVVMLALALIGVADAQTSTLVSNDAAQRARIRKVFLNLTGDPKLAHRLWTFLEIELDDAHISLANTEADADSVIDGKVTEQVHTQNLGLGVIRMQITTNGKTESLDSCASTSTDENGDLFNGSATGVFQRLREKYPKALTVKLDPASNMTRSESFSAELPRSLKAADFKFVEAANADLGVRIDLIPEKVPVVEREIAYDVTARSIDGSVPFSSKGSGVLSAGLEGPAPQPCPKNFSDLDWLANADPLFNVARAVSKQFRRANLQVSLSQETIGK